MNGASDTSSPLNLRVTSFSPAVFIFCRLRDPAASFRIPAFNGYQVFYSEINADYRYFTIKGASAREPGCGAGQVCVLKNTGKGISQAIQNTGLPERRWIKVYHNCNFFTIM